VNIEQLLEELEGYDKTMEIVIRVNGNEVNDPVDSGDELYIHDDRSILVEYGKLVIIGDVDEEL
jgi:hypothetical protein